MTPFEDIRARIESLDISAGPKAAAEGYVLAAEAVMENWLEGQSQPPTGDTHEGSRLIALHRQGAKGDPSFNACRETCRELIYRYNLIAGDYAGTDVPATLGMMRHLARHIFLFISGKMQEAKLGEFCCSSRPLRLESHT